MSAVAPGVRDGAGAAWAPTGGFAGTTPPAEAATSTAGGATATLPAVEAEGPAATAATGPLPAACLTGRTPLAPGVAAATAATTGCEVADGDGGAGTEGRGVGPVVGGTLVSDWCYTPRKPVYLSQGEC